MITDTEKQSARQTDVAFVVGQYIDIKRKGSNYVGLCPFHDERSPSFVVSPSRNQYKCFGCGASGDPIKFVMQYQSKTFPEAVKILTGGGYLDADQPARRQQYVAPITDYFSRDAMEATKAGALETNLFKWLKTQFTAIQIEALQKQFDIGGKGERVIFWQVDKAGRVRTGKVMAYNQVTGKRSREVLPSWMHQAESFNLSQCFFGESQLMDSSRINDLICIVESEKTALIAATYWPEYIWMASGGVNNMTKGKFEALRGRNVKLYPDAKLSLDQKPTPYEEWTQLAIELNRQGFSVTVSDWIENKATPEEKGSGYDLADFVTGYHKPEDPAQQDEPVSAHDDDSEEPAQPRDAMFTEWSYPTTEQIQKFEAEEQAWKESPGRLWAIQILNRGTDKNAVPYTSRTNLNHAQRTTTTASNQLPGAV
jgi:hypothetical protein